MDDQDNRSRAHAVNNVKMSRVLRKIEQLHGYDSPSQLRNSVEWLQLHTLHSTLP